MVDGDLNGGLNVIHAHNRWQFQISEEGMRYSENANYRAKYLNKVIIKLRLATCPPHLGTIRHNPS